MLFKGFHEDNSELRVKDNDIVITTYKEVLNSLPWPDKKTEATMKKKNMDLQEQLEYYITNHMDDAGLLHTIRWYRVSGTARFIKALTNCVS